MNKKMWATWGVRIGSVALVTAVAGSMAAIASKGQDTQNSNQSTVSAATDSNQIASGSDLNGSGQFNQGTTASVIPQNEYSKNNRYKEHEDQYEDEQEHGKGYEHGEEDDDHFFAGFISSFEQKLNQANPNQVKPNTRTKAS